MVEFENKKKMVISFARQAIQRKDDLNLDLLMEHMPMAKLEKYIHEDKQDLILQNVISASPRLQLLLRNLHITDWRE